MVGMELNDRKEAKCTLVLPQLQMNPCSQERGPSLAGHYVGSGLAGGADRLILVPNKL